MELKHPNRLGADAYRWDLSCFYASPDDPRMDADLAEFARRAAEFSASFKGRLGERLGDAIRAYRALETLGDAAPVYLFLRHSVDTEDTATDSRLARVKQALSAAHAEHLTFFALEIIALEDDAIARQADSDDDVRRHLPWIRRLRAHRPHVFGEAIEAALTTRAPYGSSAWSEFFDKFESLLRFPWEGRGRTLTEMLHLLTEDRDADRRAGIMKAINEGLKGPFAEYAAQALHVVAGAKGVEDRERGYPQPMSSRNMENDVPDATVEALHRATLETGAPLARRYYRLKAAILGLPRLRWSDRNARLPFEDDAHVPFEDARRMTVEAYRSFSPTIAGIVDGLFERGRVDAPGEPRRRAGAFNYSAILPSGAVETFVFMNYHGARRDVATLAHECGHAAHGVLAGEAQGPLMFHAPMAYAETASVFGERVAFEKLRADIAAKGDAKEELALVVAKLDDTMNTVVRQIAFSNFERRLHAAADRKLSVQELCAAWLETTKELYGDDGDVFTYEDMDHLWAYVSHFHRPFYVYSYAFGEMLTQGLFAKKDAFGERFEPMYLDLLRAGATKNAKELLAPFGLDPDDPKFWSDGIASSFGALIADAERLCDRAGIKR